MDEIGPRRVVVLSDRYPPDAVGGAELSLHLLLREAPLRSQSVVVTFDKSLSAPVRRPIDGVEVVALPANAAWPLHRLSQDEVERIKRRPYGLKWEAFIREGVVGLLRAPRVHAPAIALQLAGSPPGGVRMAHATVPEGRTQGDVRALLDMIGPALVHADNARSIMMAADLLKDRPEPMVALVRDHRFTSLRFDQTSEPLDLTPYGLRGRLEAICAGAALAYRQRCLRRANLVIATSAHLAGTLEEVAPSARLKQMPLAPIELKDPEPARRGDAFSILIVGSLTANKGQAHLLEAWPDIFEKIPNARIDLAGEGPARAEIEDIARRFGAGDRIRIHGRVSGPALTALYRDCDVVALPTLWAEPFGRVPLEAGAARQPVVAYASGGLVETIADGVTGLLAPIGDREAFVAALAELARRPETRARMGAAGRARVAETFAPSRLAGALAAVWDEVAGEPAVSMRTAVGGR